MRREPPNLGGKGERKGRAYRLLNEKFMIKISIHFPTFLIILVFKICTNLLIISIFTSVTFPPKSAKKIFSCLCLQLFSFLTYTARMKKNFSYSSFIKIKSNLLRQWFTVKLGLHKINRHPKVNEGEVWWCNFGENVGVEINGKHKLFLRPVIILKKYNQHFFLGLPMTSQIQHTGSWYVHFKFQDKERVCVLSQGRSLSVNRLYKRMGRLDEVDLMHIREKYILLHW